MRQFLLRWLGWFVGLLTLVGLISGLAVLGNWVFTTFGSIAGGVVVLLLVLLLVSLLLAALRD